MEIIAKIRSLFINSYQSTYVRKIGLLVAGSGSAQVVMLVTAPILSRTYSPEDFGNYGVYLSILTVGKVFTTLRYERGIMLTRSKAERHGIFELIIIISMTCAVLTFLALTLFSQTLESFLSHIDIAVWRRLLTIGLLLAGMQIALRFLILKESAYKILSIILFCTSLTLALSQLTFSIWNTESGLLIGHVFSLVIMVPVSFYIAIRNRWLDFSKYSITNFSRVRKSATRNIEFPKYMTWSAVCNSMTPQVIIFASNYLFDPGVVGQIFLAERILKRPTLLLGRAISDTSLEEASNKSRSRLLKIYKSRLKKIAFVGAVPFALLFVILPWLFPFVFGESWRVSGIYAQILVPCLYMRLVSSPFIPLFTVLREQRIYFGWSAARLVLIVAGITMGAWAGGTRGAVAGYSASLSIGYIMAHLLLVRILQLLKKGELT